MYNFGSGHYTTHFGVGVNVQLWVGELHDTLWVCIYLSTTPHKHIVVISVFLYFVEYIASIGSS